jgi:3-hydroxy-9,10-secoandrosta-1,3,5(10)-triene-9,17-dione monooxygenase
VTTFRERMRELAPALRTRAVDAEIARRVPAESIAELATAGMFRALVPRRFGGDERDVADVFAGALELARGCSSTAWCGSLFAVHSYLATRFDPIAQEELWADGPDTHVASSLAPVGKVTPVADGFLLRGRWSFVSGVDHCKWLLLGAPSPAPHTGLFMCLVRASSCTIEDDWDVAGLRATGSKSVVIEELLVPPAFAAPLITPEPSAGQRLHASPLYLLPPRPIFTSAFPPVAIGTAIANLEAFRDYIAERVSVFTGQATRLNAGPALRLAEAAAAIDAAAALYFRDLGEISAAARSDGDLPATSVERINYNVAYAVDTCSRAVYRLWRGSGGKALHVSNPLQRFFRDLHAMTQHAVLDMDVGGESYGKALLERPAFGALR